MWGDNWTWGGTIRHKGTIGHWWTLKTSGDRGSNNRNIMSIPLIQTLNNCEKHRFSSSNCCEIREMGLGFLEIVHTMWNFLSFFWVVPLSFSEISQMIVLSLWIWRAKLNHYCWTHLVDFWSCVRSSLIPAFCCQWTAGHVSPSLTSAVRSTCLHLWGFHS